MNLFNSPCKNEKLKFKIINNDKNISPNIYLCYGMHQILRSSIFADDYKDTFYLGSYLKFGFFYAYEHEIDADGNEYLTPFYSFESKNIEQIINGASESTNFNQLQTINGMKLSYNYDEMEVERIYIREIFKTSFYKM